MINTDPSTKEGKHRASIYVDARDGSESSNSIEYFDSFANPMPKDMLEDCKLIIKCLKPNNFLKLKENRIIQQSNDSANCGYLAMNFLINRLRGKSFSDATGFDEKMKINHITKNEKEIERLKTEPPFSYIEAEK